MNITLEKFEKLKNSLKEEFIKQMGDDEYSISTLKLIWDSNYDGNTRAWIRIMFIKDFNSMIKPLNDLGIRVFKKNYEDKYKEMLLVWDDSDCCEIEQFECH